MFFILTELIVIVKTDLSFFIPTTGVFSARKESFFDLKSIINSLGRKPKKPVVSSKKRFTLSSFKQSDNFL